MMVFLLPVILSLLLMPQTVYANWIVGGSLDYSLYGRFATAESAPFKSIALDVNFDYQNSNSSDSSWQYGGAAHLASVSYQVSGTEKFGGYNALGLQLGNRRTFLTDANILYSATYYPFAVMTIGGFSESAVNGKSVSNSSLTTFRGHQGFEFSVEPTRKKAIKYPAGVLHYGGRASLLSQQFTEATSKAVSSDRSKSPDNSSGQQNVNYRLLIFSIGVLVAFGF